MSDRRDDREPAGRDDGVRNRSDDRRGSADGPDDRRTADDRVGEKKPGERLRADQDRQSRSVREDRASVGRADPSGEPTRVDIDSRGPPTKGHSSRHPSREVRILRYLFDILSSVLVVGAIGALLFAASGVWPPLVAIESGSMEPHINQGDLVFVMEQQRFAGPGARADSGIVTAQVGESTGYQMFAGYGDVIVFDAPNSGSDTPIIHRAMFWVEADENWYDRANQQYLGNAPDCDALANCPAPHAGFITKGDNTVTNERYDQVIDRSGPVKPEWVMGTGQVRVPFLGEIRLLSGQAIEDRAR